MTDATVTRVDVGDAPAVTRPPATLGDSALARWLAGVLLLASAFLKWRQAFVFADFGGFEPWHKWATIGLIAGEVLLAFWLVCGVLPAVTKWIAVTVFSGFAIYTAYRWLGGYATCGCFGAVQIDPRITLGVDVAVVGLFLLSRVPAPRAIDWSGEKRVLIVSSLLGLVLAILAGSSLAFVRPPVLTPGGIAGQAGGVVRLEPSQWIDQRLPLLPYIRGADAKVGRGEWQVVLWHPGCTHCRQMMPDLIKEARTSANSTLLLNLSRSEGGPAEQAVAALVRQAEADLANFHDGRLDPAHHWLSGTPRYISVSDGTVTAVR